MRNFVDAHKRYKLLLKRCSTHKFYEMEITLIFTNGLKQQNWMFIDTFAWGAMKNKITVKIQELIDYMSLNEYRSQSMNKVVHKKQGVLSLETNDILLASNKLLNVHLEAISWKHIRWPSYYLMLWFESIVSKLVNVVHAFEQVRSFSRSKWSTQVFLTCNKGIPTLTISIPVVQIIKKFHREEIITSNHHKLPANNNPIKILRKS